MDEEELKALEAILAPKPKRTRKVRRAPPGAGLEVAVSGHEGTGCVPVHGRGPGPGSKAPCS